jgi:hypothetical protein
VGYTVRGGQERRGRTVDVFEGVWTRERLRKVGGSVGR